MRRIILAACLALMCFALAAAANTGERYAFVVGNGAYVGAAKLANPANDARAVAAKLTELGFETTLLIDPTHTETISTFSAFSDDIRGAELALFYFAGHGVQVAGGSFLLPTDVLVESEATLRFTSLDAGWIVEEMEKRAEVSLIILDACRDNPFIDQLSGRGRSASTTGCVLGWPGSPYIRAAVTRSTSWRPA